MIRRIELFLGTTRLRALFLLFALTGLASLVLNAFIDTYDWVRPVQSVLSGIALIGAAVIIGGRLPRDEQVRWLGVLTPAVGLVIIGVFVVPSLLAPLVGGAAGWIVASMLLSRRRMPMEYRQAVKHLRRNEYPEAVKVMDTVIKTQPDDPNHYRFRAEIFRVWGKLDRARRDYQTMTKIAPRSPMAFNSLAEVCLQVEDYPAALAAAQTANELAPDDWVTFYNLGMIEDRLNQPAAAISHLQRALTFKVKDIRHRALIHFFLVRGYSRLGDEASASREIEHLRKNQAGLTEWQKLLSSDQADTLRAVLGDDVDTAQKLLDEEIDLITLARTST